MPVFMKLLFLVILVAISTNLISMIIAFFQGNFNLQIFRRAWVDPEFWMMQLWMSPLYIIIALVVYIRPRREKS